MLVHLPARTERPVVVEFMARAPEEASLTNAALAPGGRLPDDGPVLANVPGAVAGMHLAWTRYGSGRLRWAELLAAAIRAAERGFAVSDGLATTLAVERARFLKYPSSRALFFPNGEPLRAGDTLRNPDLAWTLRQIADSGPDAFYRGEVARRLARDLRGQGNAMRPADLARYYAAEREPVRGSYRGHAIYSSTPPAGGGAALAAQLAHLALAGPLRPYPDDAATAHAMIEAWKLVPGTRGRIADPGLWPVRLEAYVSADSARARWRCFSPARALRPDDIRGDTLPCARQGAAPSRAGAADAHATTPGGHETCDADAPLGTLARRCRQSGTTAFVVGDAEGNVVAVTQTLGTWGGNFYVTPGLGFLYNDKLGSYASDPDEYGARLPNARHGSTLAPTIVLSGEGRGARPVAAAGAAGNAWITSAVYAAVTGVIDQRLDAQRALELPRFLPGVVRDGGAPRYVIQVESGLSPEVMRRLRALGHELEPISLPGELRMGYGAVITFGGRTVTAGADPRRSGAAGAVRQE
jgi:gamma-glutamyltranspeptidase